ncbi:glycosyltransferase family 2 protein [Pendulispora albinea]|uniref:Glycosyltransferase n=1 Tax=Pendulispora albinea TaxID=2741071 RepID=A0ABZ2MAS8_9BACT
MPTRDRRSFVPRAIQCFLKQEYESTELLILDDGDDPVRDLVPADHRIRYIRGERVQSVGAKRNVLCNEARGEIVIHWDDDDWYPSWRIRRQVDALRLPDAVISGTSTHYFCDASSGRTWRYQYIGAGPFVTGATLAYRKSFWEARRFQDVHVGEDTRFVEAPLAGRIVDLALPSLCVSTIHPKNVSPKLPFGTAWVAVEPAIVQSLLAEMPLGAAAEGALVSCIMPTAHRRAFVQLALELFAAQDYARAELIVVDSGDPVEDLCEGISRVRYVRAPRGATIGAQRNMACEHANGDIIVHWDDDDWYGPARLRRQIEPIASGRADVTGLVNQYTLNLADGSFWTMSEQLHERMFVGNVHGGTLAYRRALLADGVRYHDVNLAEDAALLRLLLRAGARLERIANDGIFVYVRHGRNAWTFDAGAFLDPAGWSRIDAPSTLSADVLERYLALGGQRAATAVVHARTQAREHAHAQDRANEALDCLGNTEIEWPHAPKELDRCVALVANERYAELVESALASLERFGDLPEVGRVLFVEGHAPRCEAIAARYGACIVKCRTLRGHPPSLKGVLYSMARVVRARQYLCLDADVLVLAGLRPLFEQHAALPKGHVLIAPEATRHAVATLGHALQSVYMATPHEVESLVGSRSAIAAEPHVINDGVFVADADALAKVDDFLRRAPLLREWVGARGDVWWRQKAALNIALAADRAIAPLDATYNMQLHIHPVEHDARTGGAMSRGAMSRDSIRVLHFNGAGRRLHAGWKQLVLG